MNYIEEIRIDGFKKFKKLTVSFNKNTNILVGDNASGKSTILEAINIVINQWYQFNDKSMIVDLFNKENVNKFKENPSLENLPEIIIELDLNLDKTNINAIDYSGTVHHNLKNKNNPLTGIRFECKIKDDFKVQYQAELNKTLSDSSQTKEIEVPYEYYELIWNKYNGLSYNKKLKPIKIINIDTDKNQKTAFNSYSKQLFDNVYTSDQKKIVKNEVRTKISEISKEVFEEISANRRFDIDSKKTILESIINIYDNNVSLDNQGSGTESRIKIELALDESKIFDIIQIEEPENHLSFINLRKIINELSNTNKDVQLIISTHSSMISSHLDLKNVIWLNESKALKLENLSSETAKFFKKIPNNSLLQLILANKVILVEGTTESILIPYFYRQLTGEDIYQKNIAIISCNGISYEHYVNISKATGKTIAVITDNDSNETKIHELKENNKKSDNIQYFTDKNVNNWTWEVCLLKENREYLEKLLQLKTGCRYLYKNQDLNDPTLGYMLNNKIECAYKVADDIESSVKQITIPDYVKEAIKWITK